jgi:hypothetical protein
LMPSDVSAMLSTAKVNPHSAHMSMRAEASSDASSEAKAMDANHCSPGKTHSKSDCDSCVAHCTTIMSSVSTGLSDASLGLVVFSGRDIPIITQAGIDPPPPRS